MKKNNSDDDTRVANARQNRIAGKILRRSREVSDMNQTDFAAAIAKRLGLGSIGQSALSGWETSMRGVPGAAIIAGAEIARSRGFDLVDAINDELGPLKGPKFSAIASALDSFADSLKGDAAEQVRDAAKILRSKRR